MNFSKDSDNAQIPHPADRTSVRVVERGSTVGSYSTRLSQTATRQRHTLPTEGIAQTQSRMPTRGTAVTGLDMSGTVTHRSQATNFTTGTARR